MRHTVMANAHTSEEPLRGERHAPEPRYDHLRAHRRHRRRHGHRGSRSGGSTRPRTRTHSSTGQAGEPSSASALNLVELARPAGSRRRV